MGSSLIHRSNCLVLLLPLVFISLLYGTETLESERLKKNIGAVHYFKYWNPYRRLLDLQGDAQTFYGQNYYQVKYNRDGRIKTVTRFGPDRLEQETYYFLWSKSGLRSEYKVEFHTEGKAQRLDKFLYADQLSYIRPGWIADVKSRRDGRPFEVSFSDKLGFTYFYYHFNYSTHRDEKMLVEVVESSYFDSAGRFVGRHLLFWEDGDHLKMIQYFNTDNKIILTKEFLHNPIDKETTRILSDSTGTELERKIIPLMQPDKYAYKLEWTGREIIQPILSDTETLEIAMEFYKKTEFALGEANEKVKESKRKLQEAKKRASDAEKILLKAKRRAEDTKRFKLAMDKAEEDVANAIESMLTAEKEAKNARLKAEAASIAAETLKKAVDFERYGKKEAQLALKAAKKTEREAKKKEKEAARLKEKAIRDSLDLGDKSFITLSYSTPFFIEQSLQNHIAKPGYTVGLGRRDFFRVKQIDINLGLEMNYYDFQIDTTSENFQTLSYFLIAQLDPKFSWYWIPKNMEMGLKVGAGLVSPGYGFTAGYSAIFNLLPTPLTIGMVTQFNWVANITSDIQSTNWSSIGLVFGFNFEDKLPSIF